MPLHDSRRRVSPFDLQHDARFGRARLRGEAVRLVHDEVHLRRLDAAHLADRPLQLSFERATVVDALREIRHSPRRLVEQLESGTTGHRHAALRQRDARLREIADGDHDVRAAALEFVFHAGLIELVGHLRHALERNADKRRHPGRSAGPLRHGEDQPRGGNADDEYEYSSSAAEAIEERCEEIRHLI